MVWTTPAFGLDVWFKDPRVRDLRSRIRQAMRMPGGGNSGGAA